MSDWKEWRLQEWNARLLDHFFGITPTETGPVVALSVTGDEFVRATGDLAAPTNEVRDAFVSAVTSGIRRNKSLFADASDYPEWPGPPVSDSRPRFVAHLLFTCVAASESSDELADETRFVSRLRELSGDQLPESSIHLLPKLWQQLGTWLASNPRDYRSLILPDPVGLTRIGYTVKLAFPDRRDQRELSLLLRGAGIAGNEPPVRSVVSLIAQSRSSFRKPFLTAYDDFRRAYEASSTSLQGLVTHRFWAAVRDAALRGRSDERVYDDRVRATLVCDDVDDTFILTALTSDRTEGPGYATVELPVPLGELKFAIVGNAAQLEANEMIRMVAAILDGTVRVPGLSNRIAQGVLPLVIGSHGLLELAGADELENASFALVRDDACDDFSRHFGGRRKRSLHPGWQQVHDCRLHQVSFELLESTSLRKTWVLQQALAPTAIRIVGGVRVDDGWLGVLQALPRIRIAANEVKLISDGTSDLLEHVGSEEWQFPQRDLDGIFEIVAQREAASVRRIIRFSSSPADEGYRRPTEQAAWLVEAFTQPTTIDIEKLWRPDCPTKGVDELTGLVEFFGPNLGELRQGPKDAAWQVEIFGTHLLGQRIQPDEPVPFPKHQVNNASSRRRWQTRLFKSRPSWSDPGFEAARRQLKARAPHFRRLPQIEEAQPSSPRTRCDSERPNASAIRLLNVIIGHASSRIGLRWYEWSELAKSILGCSGQVLERVTRAWVEAGMIDVSSFARWNHRLVIARPPTLVAYKVRGSVGATLTGLTLPTTIESMRRACEAAGGLTEERLSPSSFVPATLAVRFGTDHDLDAYSKICGLPVAWLDLERLFSELDRASMPLPQHYESHTRVHDWSLSGERREDVIVEHHVRRDRPEFWTVSCADGLRWTYHFNTARCWAAMAIGEPLLERGEGTLRPRHGYLPLPLARLASVLGQGLPGPGGRDGYLYQIGTTILGDWLVEKTEEAFRWLPLKRT